MQQTVAIAHQHQQRLQPTVAVVAVVQKVVAVQMAVQA
jgi:hypothetical protein